MESPYTRTIRTAKAGCLTQRELEVLTLIRDGYSQKQAADKLGISANTVNNHMARIREKLNAHNAIEALKIVFG